MSLTKLFKHLPGKHNQQRHAWRYGSGTSSVRRSLRAVWEDKSEREEYKKRARDKGKKAEEGKKVERDYQPANVKELQDTYFQPLNDLPSYERWALTDYTSYKYFDINGALRGTKGYELDDKIKTTVSNMDSGLERLPRAPSDMITYRGIRAPNVYDMEKNSQLKSWWDSISGLEPGDAIIDPGFTSTTASVAKANQFMFMSDDILFNVRIPKGSVGAYVAPISNVKTEQEYILPRNSRFKVVSREGNTIDIELEQ